MSIFMIKTCYKIAFSQYYENLGVFINGELGVWSIILEIDKGFGGLNKRGVILRMSKCTFMTIFLGKVDLFNPTTIKK